MKKFLQAPFPFDKIIGAIWIIMLLPNNIPVNPATVDSPITRDAFTMFTRHAVKCAKCMGVQVLYLIRALTRSCVTNGNAHSSRVDKRYNVGQAYLATPLDNLNDQRISLQGAHIQNSKNICIEIYSVR